MKIGSKEHKAEYLDKLSRLTQEGMWQTEMAKLKTQEQLAKKKALLTVIDQKIEQKEYESARDGKNEKKFTEDAITELEHEIQESDLLLETGKQDLEMIEQFRLQSL